MRKPGGGVLGAWLRGGSQESLVLALCIVYFLALIGPTRGLIATRANLANVFSDMLPLLVVAVGQTFVLIAGGIDLSATSIIALASVAGGLVMTSDGGLLAGSAWAAPAGLGVMLLVGGGVGLFNGLAIALLRMPPFMVTLTVMMFASGLAVRATLSQKIHNLPAVVHAIGQGSFLHVPYALLLAGLLSLAAHRVLSRTLFGRWLYATGSNRRAAEVSGVPVGRVTVLAYVASGLCGAAAAALYTGRLETASPVHGQGIFLDVIGAAVIGGNSLFGGRGRVPGTVLGVLFITLVSNSLDLLQLSYFTITMVKGGVILLAAVADAARARLLEASR